MNTPADRPRELVSACVICCNEEDNIRACLESVAWADEIVVVDSGSTDNTVAIAREFTDRILHHPWSGYSGQRDFAVGQAGHDWVLCLDADERVTPALAAAIRTELERVRAGESDDAGYTVPRRTFYLGRWIDHGGWYPDPKLRLFHRHRARCAGVEPHDHVYVDGPVKRLRGDLVHYTYRDMADHIDRINKFTTIAAREMHARGNGRPLLGMLFNPGLRFLRMYVLRGGFLDGMPGFIVACLASYYVFLKYAKLWELRRRPAGEETADS